MSLYTYKVFKSVVESGSFSKASEVLNMTPSAVSHAISNLEKEVGFSVFIRNRKGTQLTINGQKLLPHINNLLKSSAALEEEISQILKLESGKVRIGAFNSITIHWIPDIIKIFSDLYPNIDIQIFQGEYRDITNWIKNGTIDIGFISKTIGQDFDFLPLHKDKLLCVTPKNFIPKNKIFVTTDEIRNMKFIIQSENCDDDTINWFNKNNIKGSSDYKMRDDLSLISMVESGLGISIMPELLFKKIQANVNIYPLDPCEYRTIGIITSNYEYMSPATQKMRRTIIKYIDDNNLMNY